MNDHERFLLLAAQRISEPLSREEDDELEAHLSACPSCRATAAGMRRDDIRLRAILAPTPVAPRVRAAVLAEASGRRRRAVAGRLILVLAAAIGIAALGLPLIAGGPRQVLDSAVPSTLPSPSQASVAIESASPPPTDSPAVSVQPSPVPSPSAAASPSPVDIGSVNGSFTYSEFEPRRGSISGRFVDGAAVGAWSRRVPPAGNSKIWSGTLTCLVIDDDEAWMAGPVTVSPDGKRDQAIFILARDRGPDGAGDRILMQLSTSGETLELFEGWCRGRFRPNAPYPVTTGDIRVDPAGR
jgi:hypothetical protein